MKWLWHGKLKAWFDRHPLIFDLIKRGSWALITAPFVLAYWQWAWLQQERWMPTWAYLILVLCVCTLVVLLAVTVRKLQSKPQQSATDQDKSAERAAQYPIERTAGGAVVPKFSGTPEHYACAGCFASREVVPLQELRDSTGRFMCPKCKQFYPINPRKPRTPRVVRGGSWRSL